MKMIYFADEKKPKKKKKAKRNQTGPFDDELSSQQDDNDVQKNWEPPTRSMFKASKSPRLDPLTEPENESECKFFFSKTIEFHSVSLLGLAHPVRRISRNCIRSLQ